VKIILGIVCVLVSVSLSGQNYYDNFLNKELKKETLLDDNDGLDTPMDIDFVKKEGRLFELWVLNRGNSRGGTFTIMPNVTDTTLELINIEDSHNGHFMIYPSAVAMGTNGNFATVQEIQNTSGDNSTFMGPSLWTVGQDTFGVLHQSDWASDEPLGSHMDMLHQSPFSTGVAFEKENVYWVNDGWNGNIIRYDFAEDHGPGGEFHGDGILSRYEEVQTQRVNQIASHMILDGNSKWLYIVDTGNKRVLRLDITTGNRGNNITSPNETLAEYYNVVDASSEVIISSGLEKPAGIELVDNRLFVSDFELGKIFIYDVLNEFELLGEIAVEEGIQGIKIGLDKSLYYVNSVNEKLIKLTPLFPLSVDNIEEDKVYIYPTLIDNGILNIAHESNITSIKIFDLSGRNIIDIEADKSSKAAVSVDQLGRGLYFVQVNNTTVKKFQIQ
jgi:hypothetical protein